MARIIFPLLNSSNSLFIQQKCSNKTQPIIFSITQMKRRLLSVISSVAEGHRSAVILTSAQESQLISELVAVNHTEEFHGINVALRAC